LKLLTERNVPSEVIDDPFGFRVRGVPTNAIIVAICQRPSRLKADFMAVRAKEIDLQDQKSEISPRLMELAGKCFDPALKEPAEVQAEFNRLKSRYVQFLNEESALSEQERKLIDQIEKEEEGTNSMRPGIHIHNASFSGVGTPIVVKGGTNSPRIFMHGSRINPPPLQ
jgi:hypothetical protein